jgi:hypothetical protein
VTQSTQRGRWQRVGTVGVLLIVLLGGGSMSRLRGQESKQLGEDHLALTARYRKEAAEAREAIKRHQLALEVYRQGTEKSYTTMNPQGREQKVRHCERVIASYTETAKELDAMAAEHEVVAKQLTGSGHAAE